MENKYFCGPELSKLLNQLKIKSYSLYWWRNDYPNNPGKYTNQWYLCSDDDYPLTGPHKAVQFDAGYYLLPAYTFGDLLLPENKFKVWPEYQDQRGTFAAMVIWPESYVNDWQSWLLSELTKQEGK